MPKKKIVSDELVLTALLTCSTLDEAAKQCGLSPRQLFERRQNPAFMQQLKRAQAEALKKTTWFLQRSTGNAAAVLLEIAENRNEAAQVRVIAARAILEQAARFTEIIDFEERLEAIEQREKRDKM